MDARILNGRRALAVDAKTDILDVLGEQLENHGLTLEKATSYEAALPMIASLTYDVVMLGIMGARGLDLLQLAVLRAMPVVMLHAREVSPKALKTAIELGARAFLPTEDLALIGPFLVDVLTLSYSSPWKTLLARLGRVFGEHSGPNWRMSEKEFWKKIEDRRDMGAGTIICA